MEESAHLISTLSILQKPNKANRNLINLSIHIIKLFKGVCGHVSVNFDKQNATTASAVIDASILSTQLNAAIPEKKQPKRKGKPNLGRVRTQLRRPWSLRQGCQMDVHAIMPSIPKGDHSSTVHSLFESDHLSGES